MGASLLPNAVGAQQRSVESPQMKAGFSERNITPPNLAAAEVHDLSLLKTPW